jgi:hypothetical protein
VARGQDANWDLQNYHAYDAFALLHWRYGRDVAPAGPQSYLNPLPYVLPYLLRRHLPAVLAAVLLAAVQAVVVPLAWALSGCVVEARDRPALTVRALATVAAVTGALGMSEIGTSFSDGLLASFVLAAMLAVLHAGGGRRADRLHGLAGLVAGAAVGLKLTNAVAVPGLLLAATLPWRGWTNAAKAASVLLLGVAAGAALSGGWWFLYLWQAFGSPTFPFLNTVFRSPSAALADVSDPRFLPHGALDTLAYPVKIAAGLHPTAENAFRDSRFLLALPLSAAFAAWHLLRRSRTPSPASHAVVQLTAFLWAGFTAWLLTFAIQRYAIPFEVAAGLLAIAVVAAWTPRRWSPALCALVAAAVIAWTRPADWWHRPWADRYEPQMPPAVAAAPATVLLVEFPLGYWVQALPRGSRLALLYPDVLPPGGRLTQRLDAVLDHPPGGGVWAAGYDLPLERHVRDPMAAWGVVLAPPCYRAPSLWWVDTVFCRAERPGPRYLAASDLRVGERVAFSGEGSGWIYEVYGWQPAEADRTWAVGPASTLVLKPQDAPGGLALDVEADGAAEPDQPESEVAVSVQDQPAAHWQFRRGAGWTIHTVCVPPPTALRDGVMTLAFGGPEGVDAPRRTVALRAITLRPAAPGACPP